MKKLCLAAVVAALTLLTSCYHLVEDGDIPIVLENDTIPVTVLTRSLAGDVPYPVSIYLFPREGGRALAQQTIRSSSNQLLMTLPAGSYMLTALADAGNFSSLPSAVSSTSALSLDEPYYATVPLMMGQTALSLVNVSVAANIVLNYAVASVEVTLDEVPSDVTAATVQLARLRNSLQMDGSLTGDVTAVVPLERVAGATGRWTTGTVYVLPTVDDRTAVTITLTSATAQRVYGYTYNDGLKAGRPYVMAGTYVGPVQALGLVGNIASGDWKTPTTVSFEFGEGANNSSSSGTTTGGGTATGYTTTRIYQDEDVWQGHVVAWVENVTETEEDLVLLSKHAITDVHSALVAAYANEATSLAAAYDEDGIGGWSVPTEEDARRLMTLFAGEDLENLNLFVEYAGGDEVEPVRHLCVGGSKTYTFGNSPSVRDAASTSGTKYALRLVRRVHVTLDEP